MTDRKNENSGTIENIEEKIRAVNAYAQSVLTKKRYLHSVRVGEYAQLLAETYSGESVCPRTAYFAGLSHDICKNRTDEELTEITKADGLGIDKIEKTRLNLLHGRAAALILKNEFGINDVSVLNAVAFHTFGHKNIDALGKIIYIADKIEPGRLPETETFRKIVGAVSLNALMLAVMDWSSAYVLKTGGCLHPATKETYERLKKESF